MLTSFVAPTARYHRTTTRLSLIRTMQIGLIRQIREFREPNAEYDADCVGNFRAIVGQVRVTFRAEERFLKAFQSVHYVNHLEEHLMIEAELVRECKCNGGADAGADAGAALDCAHVFDSFLIHHATTDGRDYAESNK